MPWAFLRNKGDSYPEINVSFYLRWQQIFNIAPVKDQISSAHFLAKVAEMAQVENLLNPAYDDIRPTGSGRYLEVGEGKAFATVLEAAKSSVEGDTIVVHSGTYSFVGNEYYARYNENAPILIEHGLQIVGVGDVVFDIGDVSKGALVTAGNASGLYVENITFQGAHNRDFNGAGIRHQSGDLTVVDSVFKNNHNGILGGSNDSVVTILDSEFDSNGAGDGRSHGIYINKTDGASLIVENSHFHDTSIGHHIKSLASNTIVRGNLLDDADGTASMAIDVTAGGDLLVENNTIIQSAKSDNPKIIYYSADRNGGEEGKVIVRNNVFKNYYDGGEIVGNDTDRMVIDFLNNEIIDPSGAIDVSRGYYNSYGNTYNGDPMREGDFVELSQVEGFVTPPSLQAVLPEAPFRYAEGPDGIYLKNGWGSAIMEGTPGDDVLEAVSKGLKTMMGGAGDDLYLLNGQYEIIENAGEGFDWVLAGGSWSFSLPTHVEGFLSLTGDAVGTLNGNDQDNILVGGGAGEVIKGHNGNDTLYGGGSGNDTFNGGAGSDTVVFAGNRGDFQITEEGSQLIVAYADGQRDVVEGDVEFLTFDDLTVRFSEALSGSGPDPVTEVPVTEEPVTEEPVTEAPVTEEPVTEEPVTEDPTQEAGGEKFVASIAVPNVDDIAALAADGVYLAHGWGSAFLEGTAGNDVLEAQSNGLKTMAGGEGDDVYLLNGQWAIVENAGEGFDWAVGGGGWAINLPVGVEAYWNNSADTMRYLNGNDGDNILIGGGAGERISGHAGDDTLCGGGSGGDQFYGGAGVDTVVFDGNRADFGIAEAGSQLVVTYASGATDLVHHDVEFLSFADQTVSFADALLPPPVAQEPVADMPEESEEEALPEFVLPELADIDALAADGVYLVHGWGKALLEGTAGNDVLEAQSKGLKTMAGGEGDDIYLLNGQWAINENAGEGFDWAIGGGGWALNLPDAVEAFWNNTSDTMRYINGNGEDNILVGGGAGESFRGGDGDDTMHGGGSGGDEFRGGAGSDKVVFDDDLAGYTVSAASGVVRVEYDSGAVDTVHSDVEFLCFADQMVSVADLLIG